MRGIVHKKPFKKDYQRLARAGRDFTRMSGKKRIAFHADRRRIQA